MTAGVVKTLQNSLIVAHQDDFLVTQIEGTERSRMRYVPGAADVYPIPVPDALQLAFILARIVIKFRRQAFGVFGQTVVAQIIGCAQHVPSTSRLTSSTGGQGNNNPCRETGAGTGRARKALLIAWRGTPFALS